MKELLENSLRFAYIYFFFFWMHHSQWFRLTFFLLCIRRCLVIFSLLLKSINYPKIFQNFKLISRVIRNILFLLFGLLLFTRELKSTPEMSSSKHLHVVSQNCFLFLLPLSSLSFNNLSLLPPKLNNKSGNPLLTFSIRVWTTSTMHI